MTATTEPVRQLLPKETYFDAAWYERERRELFDRSWVFACIESDLPQPGDYTTLRFLDQSLVVLRAEDGAIRSFHNVCRHRGCEVLEGSGNTDDAIVCPYHRWTYRLDGTLRGVPNETECFGPLDRDALGLHAAAVGVYRGLVFVNPDPSPPEAFESWIAGMDVHAWPHRFDDGSMAAGASITYEMHCNWKIFYENAIDGYHLGYLHDRTLGNVYPDRNVWHHVGRHHVWYSTERDGVPKSNTVRSVELADGAGATRLHGDDAANYPGVVMLFPLTILSPSPWGFYVSVLEPVGPELTYMRTSSWAPPGGGRFGNRATPAEPIRLADVEGHPRDSGSFQIEDMWIVEKIQHNLHSPRYAVGPLASGVGAESPLPEFQRDVLDFVPLEPA